MIIFVEGPDGSGKSTLIHQLSERYMTARIPKAAENAKLWSKMCNACRSDNVLFDRSPLTECVYRTFDGSDRKFNITDVIAWLKRGKIVYCSTDTSYEDSVNRGEDNITRKEDAEKIRMLYNALISAMRAEGIEVMNYNWKVNTPDDVIKFIEGGNNNESGTI